jgi:hypothetical protein
MKPATACADQPADIASSALPVRSPAARAIVFLILFVAYQLPEGVGLRLLHSVPIMSALMLMFFPVAWAAGCYLGYRRFDAWFMGRSPGWIRLLALAFVLAVVAKVCALMLGAAIGVYRISTPLPTTLDAGAVVGLLAVLATTFFPSVAEDIVTRGYWRRVLATRLTATAFVLLSAAIYVLNHIYRLSSGPVEWLMLFSYGLAYGAALACSGSLWPAIGLHWGWNFAGGFADRLVSVEVLMPGASPLLSGGMHLLMLATILTIARRRTALEG